MLVSSGGQRWWWGQNHSLARPVLGFISGCEPLCKFALSHTQNQTKMWTCHSKNKKWACFHFSKPHRRVHKGEVKGNDPVTCFCLGLCKFPEEKSINYEIETEHLHCGAWGQQSPMSPSGLPTSYRTDLCANWPAPSRFVTSLYVCGPLKVLDHNSRKVQLLERVCLG